MSEMLPAEVDLGLPHLLHSADLSHVLVAVDKNWINSIFVMEAS